jgi:choline kinase
MLDLPIVIAAAGRGSRLGFGIPKCLVEVEGRTILDRQLDLLTEARDVRVVVGFHGSDVRAAIARWALPVRVVENRAWDSTNTLASLELATRDVSGRCVVLDGDLIVDPDDFERFADVSGEGTDPCIAITPAGTDDGVFVDIVTVPDSYGRTTVTSFRRTPVAEYEWSGLAVVHAASLRNHDGWVYETLAAHLPLRGVAVRAWEIDTLGDLRRAEAALGARVR